ncbi:RDD family protein [Cutibacterium equinum]|uniref:RDD family protein n=1 Tax=Cutibacterium equinum TaxID=3016342 RepID=A0ABY7QWJ7_9ACTN|nr:RDD family protein [Cutibacterium equinum]WCC79381.1 RDD family protein [Cutibacterium equinum]
MTNATPPPMGWYPDPAGSDQERYWDGEGWTRNLRNPPEPAPRHVTGHVPQEPAAASAASSSPGRMAASPDGDVVAQGSRWGTTADGVPLAGWWWRALATVIDFVVVWAVVGITLHDKVSSVRTGYQAFLDESMRKISAGASMSDVVSAQALSEAGFVDDMTLLVGAVIIAQAIYQFIMLASCAGSVGQLVCGLRVVITNQGKDHRRLVWWRALVRATAWACVEVGNQVLVVLTPFSYLMPLWQRSRQTIHDAIAGTQVVRPVRQPDAE